MGIESDLLFNKKFLAQLRDLIELHHSLYPRTPPQGIFFESLVEQAFKRSGWPADQISLSTANTPQHDLLVGDVRISLKTETGAGTHPDLINITKLCTTETGPWESANLVQHALEHLARYDHLLMLRALWRPVAIHYQLIEIPIDVLKRMAGVTVQAVGKRAGRPSMAADVFDQEGKLFRVHFDGADGKCQIHRLRLSRCRMLIAWDEFMK